MPSSEVFRNTFVSDLPGASLVAQMVKHLPAMQEAQAQSLGQEDPLEKGMATHSSMLAWGTPWKEEPGGLQSMVSDTTERLHFHFFTFVLLTED